MGRGLGVGDARRNVLIGVLIGLGFLTRIDAVIWIGPLLLFQLVDHWRSHSGELILRRIPWQTWIGAVIVVAPWLLFSLSYFGSLFSNSLSAKTVAYIMQPGSAFITLIQNYATLFSEESFVPSVIGILALLYLTRNSLHPLHRPTITAPAALFDLSLAVYHRFRRRQSAHFPLVHRAASACPHAEHFHRRMGNLLPGKIYLCPSGGERLWQLWRCSGCFHP